MPYRIRASYVKTVLDELCKGPERQALLDALGPTAARITSEMKVSLVSSDDYDVLLSAAMRIGGEALILNTSRRHMVRLRDAPMMRPLVDAVVRLWGLTPHAIFKIAPRARDTVVSDAGTLHYVRVADTEARLELRGFPSTALLASTTHLRGAWLGVLDYCSVHGDIERVILDAARGDVDFHIHWR